MIEIIDKLDEWMAEEYSGLTKKLWGYCELVHKTTGTPPGDQVMPVKIIDKVADRGTNQVSLDDKFELITWSRIQTGINAISNEDDNWGLKEGKRQGFTLRWVIAHKVQLGENFINTLLKELPGRFIMDGYEFVYINPDKEVDTDHEAIYLAELGKTVYEKHRFNWNLYAVSLNFEFIMCVESE